MYRLDHFLCSIQPIHPVCTVCTFFPFFCGLFLCIVRGASFLSAYILTATFCHWLFRRSRGLCQAVQAAAHQAGFHPGGRGPGPRHSLRQRVQPDHHLPLRGPPAQLQEHVQAEAAAAEVAGRGGQHHRHLRQHRQDCRPGPEAQEADEHRSLNQRSFRTAFQ